MAGGLKLDKKLEAVGSMEGIGIDFTSAPRRSKPITAAFCSYSDGLLTLEKFQDIPVFADFEALLQRGGQWIAGCDFPFGQSRTFLENIGWPTEWQSYVHLVREMTKDKFVETLEGYKEHRAAELNNFLFLLFPHPLS